jgi:4-amino-4-deoxy-L-arabinose transferase-like glycosyltransferase
MIEDIPYGMTGDEGSAGLMGIDFQNGLFNNILTSGWFSFPAIYFWFISISQRVLGPTVTAVRVVSALGGTLAIAALYYALRKIFGHSYAFLGAGFLSIHHVHILFSRAAVNNIWDGVFLTLGIGAFWQACTQNHRQSFIVAGLAMGLSQYFYTTGHLTPLYLILWIPFLKREKPLKELLPGLAIAFIVALIVFLPLGLHYTSQPEKLLTPMKRVSILSSDWIQATIQNSGKSPFRLYLEQFVVTLRGFTEDPIHGLYNPETPIFLPISATFFMAGVAIALVRFKDPRYSILIISLLGPVIAGTFSVEAPNAQRLLYAIPVAAAILTLPIVELSNLLLKAKPEYRIRVQLLIFSVFLLLAYSNLSFFFGKAMPDHRYSDRGAYFVRSLGDYLQKESFGASVYMVVPAPIGYYSLPSLQYLTPNIPGKNLDWDEIDHNSIQPGDLETIFIFQRENIHIYSVFEEIFPEQTNYKELDADGELLFHILRVGTSLPLHQ